LEADDASRAFTRLRRRSLLLAFRPHDISHSVDRTGRHEMELDLEFPFAINLFHMTTQRFTRSLSWHDRRELFLVLDGRVRFRMGDDEIQLEPGDMLIMDNLRLHGAVDSPGFNARVIVICFLQEFVYSLGSPAQDYAFLLPFYSGGERQPRVLRRTDPQAGPVYQELAELMQCYFARGRLFQLGCKAILLRVLYHLAQQFQSLEALRAESLRHQEQSQQLKKVLLHLEAHYAKPLAVGQAARMVGMSPSGFSKVFKHVAGMTFPTYLIHLRMSHAARLLRESTWLVGEIAAETGFADQSYFVRRFRRNFGQTPLAYRHAHAGTASA
jgi:AraC-like DNA-binding protein/mannose-6-phosphate isomerase-like protein (cupin superfamily)